MSDDIKDIARNILSDVVRDEQDTEARDMFSALVEILKMDEDEWMKERKRKDKERAEHSEQRRLSMKILQQQINEILFT